jgi:hypothetical protein
MEILSNPYCEMYGPLIGAALVGIFTSRQLAWRLFLIIPFIGLCVLIVFPQDQATAAASEIARTPTRLIWLLIGYLYALVFVGPWAVILGESAWLLLRASSVARRYPSWVLKVSGIVTGAAAGAAYHVISSLQMAAPLPAAPLQHFPINIWLVASIISGAVGGLIVARYSIMGPTSVA